MKKISVISIFLLCLMTAGFFFTQAHAASSPFRAFQKGRDYNIDDAILRGIEPNVLIYIDMTNPMVMSLQGQLPVFRWTNPRIMPDNAWMLAHQPRMRDANFRAALMEQNTFGFGARPLARRIRQAVNDPDILRRNHTTLPLMPPHVAPWVAAPLPGHGERPAAVPVQNFCPTRWGRHVNFDNNIIGHPDHFYSPDPNRPFLLTFRNVAWATAPAFGRNTPLPAGFPAALVPHLPRLDSNGNFYDFGPSVPQHLADVHIVPNDSKLYQLKLVLNRILAPTTDNIQLLSTMRLGLATSFFENSMLTTGTSNSVLASTALPPFAAGTVHSVFHSTTPANMTPNTINFPHGTPDQLIAGFSGGGPVMNRVQSFGGVLTTYGETEQGRRHAGRSFLRIPFDFMYTEDIGGEIRASLSLVQFKELIDGIEVIDDARSGPAMHERFLNQELTPTGLIWTAERKMYGRDAWNTMGSGGTGAVRSINLTGAVAGGVYVGPAVRYATGAVGQMSIAHSEGTAASPTRGTILTRVRNSEGFVAGTALGCVMDFFSPLPQALSFSAGDPITGLGDTRGNFPVTGSCQDNWIIYFSTGSEQNPGMTGIYAQEGRSMMRTLLDIGEASLVMRGRGIDGAVVGGVQNWVERMHVMDNPIRTIVVGLVCTVGMENDYALHGSPYAPGQENLPTTVRVRNAIRRMAHAGQPNFQRDSDGRIIPNSLVPNRDIQPIFAENTEELLRQLYAVLHAISSPPLAGGAPSVRDIDGCEEGDRSILGSSFTLSSTQQWGSSLTKLIIPDGDLYSIPAPGWVASGSPRADAGEIMTAQVATRGQRLWTTDIDHNTGQHFLVRVQDMTVTGNEMFQERFGIAPAVSTAHATAFRSWLINYGVNLPFGTPGREDGILGDMEGSAPVVVRGTPLHPLQIFRDPSTREIIPPTGVNRRIYAQTNRGVLHSIEYNTGREVWAFIPPLAQFPFVRDKKFTDTGTVFLDGTGEMRSRAMTILDGPMSYANVNLGGLINAAPNRTLLVGAMGWGGSGFYMMDITNPTQNQPNFMWAIANPRYGTPTVPADIHRWGNVTAGGDIRYTDYVNLGLTIVAPAIRRVHTPQPGVGHFVGILPGGLGYNLGVRYNAATGTTVTDHQGRALFVFNPADGGIINTIGYNAANNLFRYSPAGTAPLGMIITPVAYLTANDGAPAVINPPTPSVARQPTLTHFFTGDSEGNILFSDYIRNTEPSNWTLRSIFRVRNLEGVNNDGPIALPIAYAIARYRGLHRWLFAGTANLRAPGRNPDGSWRELANDEQYIFALNLTNHPAYDMNSPSFDAFAIRGLADLTALEHRGDAETAAATQRQPLVGPYGWRLRLQPPVICPDLPLGAEYVTAPPFLYRGALFIATFVPQVWQNDMQERCVDTGFARLYMLDPTTGNSMWRGEVDGGGMVRQALEFDNIKITGITASRGNIFLGLRPMMPGAVSMALHRYAAINPLNSRVHGDGEYLEIDPGLPNQEEIDLEPNIPHHMFLREVF